jgi:acetate kinase
MPIFAGGIGEIVSLVRARICEGLSFLGIALGEARNAESAAIISNAVSPPRFASFARMKS